ncbi:MAG: nucleotidyltransferase domain-containing protein [Ignavibacteria bacterium]|nr:nucleotidyltransferase domain-containing protein [Ignavibacteria bacterium]
MRLSNSEISAIKTSVQLFDSRAKVYLFGSRVDDKLKGGDIDILVLSEKIRQGDSFRIKSKIFEQLEEQKIDIVIKKELDDPFSKYVFKSSIEL